MDFFANVTRAPADPILGLKKDFEADTHSNKVDLTIGVYKDDDGNIPTMNVVAKANEILRAGKNSILAGGYLPIEGLGTYLSAVQRLLFGAEAKVLSEKRVVTVQSLGGTGALKYAADFLHRYHPTSKVYISDPTWSNHRGIFERAGFEVETYPYYNKEKSEVCFDKLKEKFNQLNPADIVILHACCHNPTGMDLKHEEWNELIDIIKDREVIAVIDFAYQGFGVGIDEDAYAVRTMAESGAQFLVANSFSKNFSMYRRRIGALSVVCRDAEQAEIVLTQLRTDIRTNNSNPPIDGAAIVSTVLNNPELYKEWCAELDVMCARIKKMRQLLVDGLSEKGVGQRFAHVLTQKGMFSYTGLTKDEVVALREQYGIYALTNGRVCVAALNKSNLSIVVDGIAQILG